MRLIVRGKKQYASGISNDKCACRFCIDEAVRGISIEQRKKRGMDRYAHDEEVEEMAHGKEMDRNEVRLSKRANGYRKANHEGRTRGTRPKGGGSRARCWSEIHHQSAHRSLGANTDCDVFFFIATLAGSERSTTPERQRYRPHLQAKR